MYPPSILSPELSQFLAWNPFLILIEIFRTPIYANHLPDASLITNAVSLALITLLAGWIVFTSKADQLAYRL
jgi:ABC-type polysaccharide/polyol phosphate export permease